jgi:hypothetical protein
MVPISVEVSVVVLTRYMCALDNAKGGALGTVPAVCVNHHSIRCSCFRPAGDGRQCCIMLSVPYVVVCWIRVEDICAFGVFT